jgi:hypothetical protein
MKPASPSGTGPLAISHPDDSAPNDRGFSYHHFRSLCWGAILAGAVAAMAIQVVLMMLGAGLGLAIYNPLSDENPVASLGVGAVIIQGLTAVVSLWVGGWVAGRFAGRTTRCSGCLHGFMVWCLATVVAILIVSSGAGWALGDMGKIVGGGLSMAGKPAAAAVGGVTDLAKSSLERNDGMLASFLDEGLSNAPSGQTEGEAIRAKRDLGFALARLATADEGTRGERQQQVVTLLQESQGLSATEAREMVDDWTATYRELKADLAAAKETLAQRAREVADETAKTLAILSLCSFVAFVIGAIAASLGGQHGCKCAGSADEVGIIEN